MEHSSVWKASMEQSVDEETTAKQKFTVNLDLLATLYHIPWY